MERELPREAKPALRSTRKHRTWHWLRQLDSPDTDAWSDSHGPCKNTSGEARLALAVIESALRAVLNREHLQVGGKVYRGHRYKEFYAKKFKQISRSAAWQWIFDESPRDNAYNFVFLCEAVGLCPEALRSRLRRVAEATEGQKGN